MYEDELKPIAELDSDNNVTGRFVYGVRGNIPDYKVKGGQTYRILSDHLEPQDRNEGGDRYWEKQMPITTFSEKRECSCDIEIAFPSINLGDLMSLSSTLSSDEYQCEDKSNLDWGCVIARRQSWEGDRREISDLIIKFLDPLSTIIDAVQSQTNSVAIVRLGIYHNTFTFTFSLDQPTIKSLDDKKVEFEISIYPSD